MYDFETLLNRRSTGSLKWEGMDEVLAIEEGIAPFHTSDLDMKNPPELIDGLLEYIAQDGCFGYTGAQESYYRAVINWMKDRHDWDIKKEWIVNHSGSMPAIYNTIREFSDKDDGVIVFTPVYHNFFRAINNTERKLIDCPLKIVDGQYRIDYDLFSKLAGEVKNKILIFCSPHNPIGRVWLEEELKKLLKICRENDILVISDEIHADLVQPGHKHNVLAKLNENDEVKIVTCTSSSKAFNVGGLQIAAIIVSDPSIRERVILAQQKSGVSLNNSLCFKVSELVFNNCRPWLAALNSHIGENYRQLTAYLKENLPAVIVYPLEATYLAWLDFGELGIPREELYDLIVKRARVYVDYGKNFGSQCEGYARMNIGCPTKTMLEALERINSEIHKII